MIVSSSTAQAEFHGPLFVVGMPRSGTKLLRAIINRHPQVSIPQIETEFFPYWVATWPTYGDLSEKNKFEEFVEACRNLPFFIYLRDGKSNVDVEAWYRACPSFSAAGVFEGLIRSHLALERASNVIWGDKSPSYIGHLQTLKREFPEARFIHIIRDVRDYCLSINKAWGKNMMRAAQRWADDVSGARLVGAKLGGDYLEVRYEDLLQAPGAAAREVCAFLGIPFGEELLQLTAATENLGSAKGRRGIVKDNVRKFESGLDEGKRIAIESIANETLVAAGYESSYRGKTRRLGPWRLRLYQSLDAVNLIVFSARERGLRSALGFVFRYFKVSGNRQRGM